MKIPHLFLVSILIPSLAVFTTGIDPAYARRGKTQAKAVKAKTIRGQKDLLAVLQAAYQTKSDKKYIPQFVKNVRNVNGVALPNSALRQSNSALAKTYSEQLSSRGVTCLKAMKAQIRSLSKANHAIRCDKSTLVLVLRPQQDGGRGDKPGYSSMDFGAVIVVLTLVGMGVALTQKNDPTIVPGSLADNILKVLGSGNNNPPAGGDSGDDDDDDDDTGDSGDGESSGGGNE